jgi:diguanylate cyclase (GGDEF)-like protein
VAVLLRRSRRLQGGQRLARATTPATRCSPAVAGRLRGAVRASDTVARFGGDEFAIVAGGLRSEDDALRIAEQALAALEAPVSVDSTQLYVGASIGIGISAPDADADPTR